MLDKKFARPEYDVSLMWEFLFGYLWGLSEEEIEFYTNPELQIENKYETTNLPYWFMDSNQRTILRMALLKGLTVSEVEFILQKFLPQDSSQSKFGSLKSILEEFTKDKKAKAKIRALVNLNTKLKEGWKRTIFKTKGNQRGFTL